MKFKLKDVLPNPYRNLKRFALSQAKVEALVKSINSTTFWENLVGRKTSDGRLEIAYGHHRVGALNKIYKGDLNQEFDFIVRDLSNAMMIKIMHQENDEVYGNDLRSTIEDVRATVMALAEGEITSGIVPRAEVTSSSLDLVISEDTNKQYLRRAPSFIANSERSALGAQRPYTIKAVAAFLESLQPNGDPQEKIEAAFAWLEAEQRNINTPTLAAMRKSTEAIPAKEVLKATRDSVFKAERTKQIEAERAAKAKQDSLSIKQQLENADKDVKAREAELRKQVEQRTAATKKEDEEKIERIKKEMIETEAKRKAAEVKREAAEAEWKANEKQRKQSLEAQQKAKDTAEKKAEANRAAVWTAATAVVDRRGTNEDPLFEQIKNLGKDKRATQMERNLLIEALEEMSSRILQLRVFVRPELGKKK